MTQRLWYTPGLVVLGLLAFSGSVAHAQTVAPGPYYPMPSWDQTLACTTKATCPRFIVLSNFGGKAVLDRETGLVWEQSPSLERGSWRGAHQLCIGKIVGNRGGWRLPTIQELASLIDPTQPLGLGLPAGHPFSNVQSNIYWSATTAVNAAHIAWAVNFGSSDSVTQTPKDSLAFVNVWCVRGGGGQSVER